MKEVSHRTSSLRLLRLAQFLHELPRHRFNYETFVGSRWEGAQDLSCGTTACALGWAATMPEFRRLGLRLLRVTENGAGSVTHTSLKDTYKSDEPFEAASIVFGINTDEAIYLFAPGVDGDRGLKSSPSGGATPKQVAAHIRQFVAWRDMRDKEYAAAISQ